MTSPVPSPSAPDPVRWLNHQPYLLLSLTALFWAGNIVLARYVAGHLPPPTLTCIRWIGVFLILLPFALPHLKRDWPALRANLPMTVLLSALASICFNKGDAMFASSLLAFGLYSALMPKRPVTHPLSLIAFSGDACVGCARLAEMSPFKLW